MKVRYKKGSRITCCSASLAYKVIEQNRKENGGNIDLDRLVEHSKPKDAPLHNAFDWNDKEIGHKWRRQQARYIVRNIEVVDDKLPTPYRAYESVTVDTIEPESKQQSNPRHVYRSTAEIMRSESGRAQLLQNAIRDIYAFKKKYAMLSELSILIQTMDGTLDDLAS
jgi:hypothetical protein